MKSGEDMLAGLLGLVKKPNRFRVVRWFLREDDADGERGSVLVLVALMMVMLCGFVAIVTDVGYLYLQKQQAQSAADSAALAGADVLLQGGTTAAGTASAMAQADDPNATFTVQADTVSNTVTVSAVSNVQMWFARIWGINSVPVHAGAVARLGALSSAVGVVPIGVPNQTFAYGQEVYLSEGAGNGETGNYGFLDLSGQGAEGVSHDIEHGYSMSLSVGQQVPTETGVMTGPVSQGVQYRISEDANDTACNSFDTARGDCARVVYLPIVSSLGGCGKTDVTILGFAAFYLEGIDNSGGHQQIVGKFMQMVRTGAMGSGANYGTFAVKLSTS